MAICTGPVHVNRHMPHVRLILIIVALALGWGMSSKKPGAGGEEKAASASTQDCDSTGLHYLALGDSYTIGEAVRADERYPAQVRRMLLDKENIPCEEPQIIAATGWTTRNLLNALGPATEGHYDIVSILIGVNNQFQGRSETEYAEEFEQLLRRCILLAGNRPGHVLVLSIPDYSVTPFGRMGDTALIPGQIDSFNRINAMLAQKYSTRYLDVTEASRKADKDPSLIAADGLHFSGKEYAEWAALMVPVIKQMQK